MAMKLPVVKTIDDARRVVATARAAGKRVGLVPTMGALHAGHASLIRAARAETGFVVVSIFVNPAQFGPNEDFARYPRSLEDDLELCGREGGDLVFLPEPRTMYPEGFCTFVEVTGLQDGLCGASRPGHFRGVATVVLKLFNIIQPDRGYFGQKDAQQVRLIQQLVRDLNLTLEVCVCPIVREPDGLALSSRNRCLDPDQRRQATALYQALQRAHAAVAAGQRDGQVLQRLVEERIASTRGALLDYAAVVDADTLQPQECLRGRILVALAVRFGSTRLIDNEIIKVPPSP
jgi:pantoate--beta-alanine ligase